MSNAEHIALATGFIFGHAVEWDGVMWTYVDDGSPAPAPGNSGTRPCPKCDQMPTPKGHDPCLGALPGVAHACCGHGVQRGYVQFKNGCALRGEWERTMTVANLLTQFDALADDVAAQQGEGG